MSDLTRPGLKKHDLKVHTVVFMIFALCAAGAYGIEDMIPAAGPGLTLLILIVLPFVWSLPLGMVASELGSAMPQEGGYYRWVQKACGEFWGFQAGWWRTISIYVDNTIYVILAGAYLASVTGINPTQEYIFKAAVIILFTYINLRGIGDVGALSTIFSLLVLIAFAGVTIIGFMHWNTSPVTPFIPEGQGVVESLGYGLAIGLWMYAGYESMSTVAGEVENPQVIPKATMITIPMMVAAYVLPTLAGLASVGNWEAWGSEGGLSYGDIAMLSLGQTGAYIFVAVAVIAQFSIFNTYIASGSRGFFALAEDHLAPPVLVKCSKKHGVPYVTVLSLGIFCLFVAQFDFQTVVVVDVFLLMSAYALIFIAGVVLRYKMPDMERPFRIPVGKKMMTAMCVIPLLIIFVTFFISGTDYFIGGMVGIISGPVMYFIWKRMYGGMAKVDPQNYPLNEKTKLGVGDTKHMAIIFAGLTFLGIAGIFFLPWYEDPTYYAEAYVSGFFSNFDWMMNAIKCTTVVCASISIFCFVLSKKVEPPKKNEKQTKS